MAASILESSKNSGHALKSAQDAVKLADEGGAVVNRSIERMQLISEAVRNSAKNIEYLGD